MHVNDWLFIHREDEIITLGFRPMLVLSVCVIFAFAQFR